MSNTNTPTNFNLVIPKLPSSTTLDDSDHFTLKIHGAVIPSITFEESEQRFLGILANNTPHHNANYDDLNVSFTVANDFSNWKTIYDWMMYISNQLTPESSHIKPIEYSVKASLIITDNFNNTIQTITFHEMWPLSLGDVTLSYRDGEVELECSSIFKYSHFTVI